MGNLGNCEGVNKGVSPSFLGTLSSPGDSKLLLPLSNVAPRREEGRRNSQQGNLFKNQIHEEQPVDTSPVDPEQIKRMSLQSRAMRDAALQNFDWEGVINQPEKIDKPTLTAMLIHELNRILPEGFAVTFYAKDLTSQ